MHSLNHNCFCHIHHVFICLLPCIKVTASESLNPSIVVVLGTSVLASSLIFTVDGEPPWIKLSLSVVVVLFCFVWLHSCSYYCSTTRWFFICLANSSPLIFSHSGLLVLCCCATPTAVFVVSGIIGLAVIKSQGLSRGNDVAVWIIFLLFQFIAILAFLFHWVTESLSSPLPMICRWLHFWPNQVCCAPALDHFIVGCLCSVLHLFHPLFCSHSISASCSILFCYSTCCLFLLLWKAWGSPKTLGRQGNKGLLLGCHLMQPKEIFIIAEVRACMSAIIRKRVPAAQKNWMKQGPIILWPSTGLEIKFALTYQSMTQRAI